MSYLNHHSLEHIDNLLLEFSIYKRYKRAVVFTYLFVFFIALICVGLSFVYHRHIIIKSHKADVVSSGEQLDSVLAKHARMLQLLQQASLESLHMTHDFDLSQWNQHSYNGYRLLVPAVGRGFSLTNESSILIEDNAYKYPFYAPLMQVNRHLASVFPKIAMISPLIQSAFFISEVGMSYYPQHDSVYLRKKQQRLMKTPIYQVLQQQNKNDVQWYIDPDSQNMLVAMNIVHEGQFLGVIFFELDVHLLLKETFKDLTFSSKSLFLDDEHHVIWHNMNLHQDKMKELLSSVHYGGEDSDHDVMFSHQEYFIHKVNLFSMHWTYVVLEKNFDLLDKLGYMLLLTFIMGLCVLLLVVSFVHMVTGYAFINPAIKLLSHLEECARSPVLPPLNISSEWQPWFKLVSQIFREHQKNTINLSNQNKRLDKLVVQRTQKLKEINARRERDFALLRSLIDSIPDAIEFKDKQGKYLGFNKAAQVMLGISEHHAIGSDSVCFEHNENQADKVVQEEEFILRNHTSRRYQECIKVGHRVVWIDVHKFCFYNRQGDLQGLIGIRRDITREKASSEQLRLSEERYHLAMDAVEDGLWDWYLDKDKWFCNAAFYTMLNYEAFSFDWNNDFLQTLVHPNDQEVRASKLEHLLNHPQSDYAVEFRMRCQDGHYIWILARGRVVEFNDKGRPQRIIGTHKDITQHKENEVALVEAKQEAESVSLYKSQFLANMSHEIRTPMNAMLGMLQLIKQTTLNTQQQDYVEKAERSTNSLLAIVNDILDFSKIEAGKLDVAQEQFWVHDVLQQAAELLALSSRKPEVELLIDADMPLDLQCLGDSLRLGQILNNLLVNAIKFTETGYIEVGCRLLDLDATTATLRFWVRDTGIGMSAQQQKNLFIAFSQVDGSITRRFGGTGLGLSICQNLVRLMGGEIVVNSQEGEGSEFSFELSFKLSAPPSDASEALQLMNNKQTNVLILNKNKRFLDVHQRYFKRLGCVVEGTHEPSTFLFTTKIKQPMLVVMDEIHIDSASSTVLDVLEQQIQRGELKTRPYLFIMSHQQPPVPPNWPDAQFLQKPLYLKDIRTAMLMLTQHSNPTNIPLVVSQTKQQAHAYRVLLVEDNIINQQIASELLKKQGYTVEIADNGKQALNMVSIDSYDVVLMDIQMPIMDGFSTTTELRKYFSKSELPIIAMTAHAMQADRDRSVEVGMNDYVTKPFKLDELLNKLNKAILTSAETK